MTAQFKRILMLLVFALPIVFSQIALSQTTGADDEYKVIFKPWANRQIVFRDADGKFLGNSAANADLQMLVSGEIIRRSTISGQVDVPTLLSQLQPVYDKDGHAYLIMDFPMQTVTAEGRIIAPGTKVMLDVRDFYQTKILQPSGAMVNVVDVREASNDQVNVANQFNEVVATGGVTEATKPKPQTKAERDQQVEAGDEENIRDDDYLAYGKNAYTARGRSWGITRFLSAPTCSCPGNSCHIGSKYGRRKPPQTPRGPGSSYHRGIDIGSYGRRVPVIAAADGCIGRPIVTAGGYGTTIYLSHGNGIETQYSHLGSLAAGVRYGQCFKRGERLGTMGDTGKSKGVHLHFGVLKNGVIIDRDPRNFMIDGTTSNSTLSRSCGNQKSYPEIDAAMESALGNVAPAALIRHHRARRAQ